MHSHCPVSGLHDMGRAQLPHLTLPPQPSSNSPHMTPSCSQPAGTQISGESSGPAPPVSLSAPPDGPSSPPMSCGPASKPPSVVGFRLMMGSSSNCPSLPMMDSQPRAPMAVIKASQQIINWRHVTIPPGTWKSAAGDSVACLCLIRKLREPSRRGSHRNCRLAQWCRHPSRAGRRPHRSQRSRSSPRWCWWS